MKSTNPAERNLCGPKVRLLIDGVKDSGVKNLKMKKINRKRMSRGDGRRDNKGRAVKMSGR